MDEKTRTELEAAVYRRLVEHLRSRTDVQKIDMMNLPALPQLPLELDEGSGRHAGCQHEQGRESRGRLRDAF